MATAAENSSSDRLAEASEDAETARPATPDNNDENVESSSSSNEEAQGAAGAAAADAEPCKDDGDGGDSKASEEFECNICLDVARDAVISVCGHLFCWPCLHQVRKLMEFPFRMRNDWIFVFSGWRPGPTVRSAPCARPASPGTRSSRSTAGETRIGRILGTRYE